MICPNCQSTINNPFNLPKSGIRWGKSDSYNEANNRAKIYCPNCHSTFVADYKPMVIAFAMAFGSCIGILSLQFSVSQKIAGILVISAIGIALMRKLANDALLRPFSKEVFEEFHCEACGAVITRAQAKQITWKTIPHYYCIPCGDRITAARFWGLVAIISLMVVSLFYLVTHSQNMHWYHAGSRPEAKSPPTF